MEILRGWRNRHVRCLRYFLTLHWHCCLYHLAGRKKDQWKDLPPDLQVQWKKDREKKAERKRMREALRLEEAADSLVAKKGGKKGRKASKRAAALGLDIPNAVVDLASLEKQIRRFIENLGQNSMPLPAMDKESRKRVHELAGAFNLKSQSKGKGSNRYTTLIRTSMTGVAVKEKKVSGLVRRYGGGDDRFNAPDGFRGGGGGGGRAPKHREGDEVGKVRLSDRARSTSAYSQTNRRI